MSSSVPSPAVGTVARAVVLRSVLLAVLGLAPLAGLQAAIPPGATPGGAQPILPSARPVLPDPDQEVFNIPPVFERPLGVDEGDRVFVRGFVLTGIVDDAGAGIDAAEVEQRVQQRFTDLQRLLESLRVDKQEQTDVDADGFTPEERQRILSFIRDVIGNLDADAQVDAYQGFVNELRLQRLQRDQGMTIGQIGLVADEVTKYYRERGYILARAIVPAQEVVDGIVTIHVLEGRLAKVSVENNQRIETPDIEAPFRDLIGKLVTVERMEHALLTLSNYPGILVTGVFRPGPGVGTTEMVINVRREDALQWSLRADNHGSRQTGEGRALLDLNWNNPTGDSDVLNVTLLQSYQPKGALFGALRYESDFPDPSYRWGVEASRNAFDAFNLNTGLASGITGTSEIGKLYLEHYLKRSRAHSTFLRLDLSRKRSTSETLGILSSQDDLAVLGLELGDDRISSATNTISSRFFRVDRGFDAIMGVPTEEEARSTGFSPGYSRTVPSVQFIKYTFGYTALKALPKNQTLLFRLSGSYTDDYLVSMEQYNIGGPTTVRGAPVSAALRDYGAFTSLEYSVRAPGFADKPAWWGDQPWGRVFGVSLFFDQAVGYYNRRPNEAAGFNTSKITLGGWGAGFDLRLPGDVSMRAMWAKLNGGTVNPGNPSGIDDANQLWLEFSRGF